jgi:hypothetical protein
MLSNGFGLGEGRPLDAAARRALTPRFGDLAAVRIHDDATAARAARSAGARAFAIGNDLVFSEGAFDPHTPAGRGLLAHEVAHVAQGGSVLRRQPLDELEEENEPIAPAPRPRSLLSLDYSSPDVCGGERCVTDEEIYGPLERAHAELRLAEARATDWRMTVAMIDTALVELVNQEQRGTRQHRYARERLEAFRSTGQLLRPRVNMEGGPSVFNVGVAVMAPMALACAAFPAACGVVGAWTGGVSAGETITGESSGFLNPGRLLSGDTEIGRDLSVGERVLSGFNALLSLFGIGAAAWAARSAGALRFVGPVFQYAERDIIIVETSLGRQAFYRSTGQNSGMPGRWLPFDEVTNIPPQLRDWFNKAGYTEGIPVGAPLHRVGTPEFARISDALTEMNIGAGAPLLSARHVNDILDFYGARLTQYSMQRPGLE